MGRIKTKWMKTMAIEFIKKYPDKLNHDFENNKKVLNEAKIIKDKIIRNKIAGYIGSKIKKGNV